VSLDNDTTTSTLLLFLAVLTAGYLTGLLTCDLVRQTLLEYLP
jgi:hypothetical protein